MRLAVFIQQDVSRLDVAMQNSMLVRELHRARNFYQQFRCAPWRHRRAADYFVELTAFDEFHTEVARSVAFADFVDRNNLRMLQACCRFRLVTKTF